jgi:MoxR-like ATPase
LSLTHQEQIDTSSAELSRFEAARAHAAADDRLEAMPSDVQAVALLALRQRLSQGLVAFFEAQQVEDAKVEKLLNGTDSD